MKENLSRRSFFVRGISTLISLYLPSSIRVAHSKNRETVINRFYIAGFQYYKGGKYINRLRVGNLLRLVPEPDNPYDNKAVEVYFRQIKLGYIPRSDNPAISRLLTAEKTLHCRIVEINPKANTWEMLKVEVSLVS